MSNDKSSLLAALASDEEKDLPPPYSSVVSQKPLEREKSSDESSDEQNWEIFDPVQNYSRRNCRRHGNQSGMPPHPETPTIHRVTHGETQKIILQRRSQSFTALPRGIRGRRRKRIFRKNLRYNGATAFTQQNGQLSINGTESASSIGQSVSTYPITSQPTARHQPDVIYVEEREETNCCTECLQCMECCVIFMECCACLLGCLSSIEKSKS